jgi:hypothetical protein
MLAGFEGAGDRVGHLQLTAAFAAAQCRHRSGQQLRDGRWRVVARGYSCVSAGGRGAGM